MPKVLYLFDALKRGGVETSTLEIIKGFKEWDTVVVSIYEGTDLKPDFEKANIKVYALNIKAKFGILSGTQKIQKIIEIEKPDLIHANLFMAEQFSRWLGPKNKIPIINSFINDSYSKERYELLSLKQKLVLDVYKSIDRFSANRVDKFTSLTKAIIQNNSKALKISPDNVQVIPRGRDFEKFRKRVKPDKVFELKKKYGEGPIILTVSRLLIRKGYLEAIKAMEIVVKEYPKIKYLIAGKGHDKLKIKSLIEDLNLENNIFLLGSRSDVPTLLQAADIFLFPSHYEGQGGALIEAMIMGKKIIGTKIPVLEETVNDNYSARLFKYRDIHDMADKIIWAIENSNEMEKFAKNAIADAESNFNIDQISIDHEKLYNSLIKRQKP